MTGVSTAAAVVALKQSPYAKSRLHVPAPLRRRLAWTMALDTLSALAPAVTAILVVSDQPALQARLARAGIDALVHPEPDRGGLNAALAEGSAELRRRGHRVVLACVGDLPALQTPSVERIVGAATGLGRSFLADASGVGTTMLIADDVDLRPIFQGRSAAAHHNSGAVGLTAERLGEPLADARRDVDTEVDLEIAWSLGLGPHTAALVDRAGRLGRYAVITATAWRDPGGEALAVTADGHRIRLSGTALADGLRQARSGQRLHAALADGQVLSAWLSS
jgi:2-phospho-L-lactate/phosphoenolpyruvate guanylyltransferase